MLPQKSFLTDYFGYSCVNSSVGVPSCQLVCLATVKLNGKILFFSFFFAGIMDRARFQFNGTAQKTSLSHCTACICYQKVDKLSKSI